MDKINILIVEDETIVALELFETIKKLGFNVVDYATNITMAKDILKKNDINLILMDINLKEEIDGIDFYTMLPADKDVIYLTAYKDMHTIEKAVQTNPLGYIIKPHKEDELLAILKLAEFKLKNSHFKIKEPDNIINFGSGYYFDKKFEKLFFNDININLGTNELKLLKLLIEYKGNVVTFKNIEDEVYGDKQISDSTLRTLIYRLKGKMEYKFIKSEFNLGIKLEY